MSESNLEQAIAAIKGGDKATGKKLLLEFIKANPKHEGALLWLSATTDDPAQKRKCFEQVLKINPHNERAKEALARLQSEEPEDDLPDLDALVGTPAAPPASLSKEQTYHKDKRVTVTSARAIIDDSTYPMRNIASVSSRKIEPNNTGAMIAILIGLLIGMCAFVGESWAFILAGGTVIFVGVLVAATNKTKYAVRIGTSSGETNALTSINKAYIEKIVEAINTAIIERG